MERTIDAAATADFGGPPILTIGCGSRTQAELFAALRRHGIACLVDVRSEADPSPLPELTREALQSSLPQLGVRYVYLGHELGGRPEEPALSAGGEPDYDLVRRQPLFIKGLQRLQRARAQGMRLVVLGAEGPPEACHRSRWIGAALAESGVPVVHLDASGDSYSQLELMRRLTGDVPAAPELEGSTAAPDAALEQARRVLSRVFGYDEFRALQAAIIGTLLAGRDCLGVMPTGSGKSLCYQLPALLWEGLTVVVSPLLALMQDQVDQLQQLGVAAVTLNSMIGRPEYAANVRRIRSGEVKLLFVAPETLLRPETLSLLEETRLSCLTVDEAHCISEWGHDFRPEYRGLGPVRARFPKAVCLALTATATPRVRDDIRASLRIPPESAFVAGFDRPNLYLEVRRRDSGTEQVLELLKRWPQQSGIVYCSTRAQVDTLVSRMQSAGIRALPYHAGLDDTTRRENQRLFIRDEVPVMVATVAFGMGINKSNVRYVIHHNLPDCLETYYQQVGRAGRDGLRSECVLLFARADVGTIMHFIQDGAAAERMGRTTRLQAMVRYAEASDCRRSTLLPYFDDAPAEPTCGMCDNCLAEAGGRQRVDVSEDARLFLRCLQQTRERFGITHLVEVLRGSRSARILKWRHETVPAYGAGKHRSADEWRILADRFIEQGLVAVEMEHGTLRLAPAGEAVLAGGSVEVLLETPTRTTASRTPAAAAGTPEYDSTLFEMLRARRRELAEAAGVPPYVVFSDRTLVDMAAYYPRTREELLRVQGVGERKADVYGETFLELIRGYVSEQGITPPPRPGAPRSAPAPVAVSSAGTRAQEVGDAFQAGASLAELMERFAVTENTIITNLQRYADGGGVLNPERLRAECRMSPAEQEQALQLFDTAEQGYLAPIRAALGGEVPYRDLHLLRLYHRAYHSNADGGL